MENQDKIFEQFKKAAENSEIQDFPGMEKIWSRVDAKLDTKIYKKQHQYLKKFAIAGSVIIVFTLLYTLLKTPKNINIPQNKLVKKEIETIIPNKKLNTTIETPIVKNDKEKKGEIILNSDVLVEKKKSEENNENSKTVSTSKTNEKTKKQSYLLKGRIFDAIGVTYKTNTKPIDNEVLQANPVTIKTNQTPPLILIDGKAITSKNRIKYGTTEENAITKLSTNEEIESIVLLKEPLYIINGTHYTEESLFGEKPTSPYAPLNQQEIKSIQIFQDQEAIEKYGDKGKKGVVVIITKTGRPVINIKTK